LSVYTYVDNYSNAGPKIPNQLDVLIPNVTSEHVHRLSDPNLSRPVPVSPHETPDCSALICTCKRFVKTFHEFAGETYDELEFSVSEPYMTPGFFQSCFLVQLLMLEELTSFGEPAFCELIEAEYDDSYAFDCG
jgi:hypothetical protein